MIYLNDFASLSCLGATNEEAISTLSINKSSYLKQYEGYLADQQSANLGKLIFVEDQPDLDTCRNIQFLDRCLLKLEPLIQVASQKFGLNRIACVIGTSTSAITDVENAAAHNYQVNAKLPYDRRIYEVGCLSKHIKQKYNLTAPCYTIATACSSSGRALISAAQLLEADLCDAVIVGGSDSLSKITVSGFNALSALSKEQCLPFHKDRNGINIGEGVALTIATKLPLCDSYIKLIGYGATSDGYHISAPEPSGEMAIVAMQAALKMAQLKPQDLGYINVHGTGTKLNDAMEGNAIYKLFGDQTPISSTKHLTGHTLGAASIVEAYICSLILNHNLDLPFHNYTDAEYKEEFSNINLITEPHKKLSNNLIMSNSFAFGGNNISLIFQGSEE